jgi:hypothetical protein
MIAAYELRARVTCGTPFPRTPDVIARRLVAIRLLDWVGWGCEVLVGELDYADAVPVVADLTARGVAAVAGLHERLSVWDSAAWDQARGADHPLPDRAMRELGAAVDVLRGHAHPVPGALQPGIAASRSVYRLHEYAWLMGRVDVEDAMDRAPYPRFGAPMVKAFALGLGYAWPNDPVIANLAEGRPCSRDCPSSSCSGRPASRRRTTVGT